MYGEAKVTHENGKLVLRTPAFTGDLEHWHYETFRLPGGTEWRKDDGHVHARCTSQTSELNIADLGLTFKRAPDEAKPATRDRDERGGSQKIRREI